MEECVFSCCRPPCDRVQKLGSFLSYLDCEPGIKPNSIPFCGPAIKRNSIPFCGQRACDNPDISKDCKVCQKRRRWYLNYLKNLNDSD